MIQLPHGYARHPVGRGFFAQFMRVPLPGRIGNGLGALDFYQHEEEMSALVDHKHCLRNLKHQWSRSFAQVQILYKSAGFFILYVMNLKVGEFCIRKQLLFLKASSRSSECFKQIREQFLCQKYDEF